MKPIDSKTFERQVIFQTRLIFVAVLMKCPEQEINIELSKEVMVLWNIKFITGSVLRHPHAHNKFLRSVLYHRLGMAAGLAPSGYAISITAFLYAYLKFDQLGQLEL
jgi:hypothetical protein